MTLADTIIAMVLASLVMGMGGYFYLGLVKTMNTYQTTNALAGDIQRLAFMMQAEKDCSDKMLSGEQRISFVQFKEKDSLLIEYAFEKTATLRLQNGICTDTLLPVCRQPEFFYQGVLLEQFGLCDHAVLPFFMDEMEMEITLFKVYPAFTLINHNYGR